MSKRKTWLTKSGVEVFSRGRIGGKIDAYRVSTGARHGWLWLKNLREVKP